MLRKYFLEFHLKYWINSLVEFKFINLVFHMYINVQYKPFIFNSKFKIFEIMQQLSHFQKIFEYLTLKNLEYNIQENHLYKMNMTARMFFCLYLKI